MFKNKANLIILFFCAINLTLHVIADFNSGFQGDELLHIETGNHPAFGYMEFPPVIGWLAFIQNLFHSNSVFVNHIFCHIASTLILILAALITIALGGKSKAVFIILLCISVMPARAYQLFQPVVFTHLFWLLSFYQLVRFSKTLDNKYLLYLTVSLASGFLTKFDILFFIAGLVGLLLFERTRKALLTKSIWKYIFIFFLIISPNLWWQYQHQFPVLNMFSLLYKTQLDKLTISGVLKDLIIMLNPLTLFIWIGGLFFMFNKKYAEFFRPVAASILISILLFAITKSKAYYFVPAILTLLMFGSAWLEQNVLAKRKWVLYPATILLIASGILFAPFGLSLLPLDSFVRFAKLKMKNDRFQNDRFQVDCQEYFAQTKWKNTLTALKETYDSLPKAERQTCMIWGKHYSQAGGVNLYRADYGLPKAFSYHGSFYLWNPESGTIPKTIIAFTNGEAEIDFFQDFFSSVVAVKKVYNPYASFDRDLYQTIFICKEPKLDFAGLRVAFKDRIFE
jgi:Dolichyl-phosphate-mannose-protein mannosyltransferase